MKTSTINYEQYRLELKELQTFSRGLSKLYKAYDSLDLKYLFTGDIINGLYNSNDLNVVLNQFITLADDNIKAQGILLSVEKSKITAKYMGYYDKYMYDAVVACGKACFMKLKSNNPANAFILNPETLEVTLSTKAVEGELKEFCTYNANEKQLKFMKEVEKINSAINDFQAKYPKLIEHYSDKFSMLIDLIKDDEADLSKIIFSKLID